MPDGGIIPADSAFRIELLRDGHGRGYRRLSDRLRHPQHLYGLLINRTGDSRFVSEAFRQRYFGW